MPTESPNWVATLCDMLTNLLTFFVLLLSFASFRPKGSIDKEASADNPLGGSTGVLYSGDKVGVAAQDKIELGDMSLVRTVEDTKDIEEFALKKGWLIDDVGKSFSARGALIYINSDILFDPGGARIKWGARKLLNVMAEKIKKGRYKVVVEGHTDDILPDTAKFPSNWELSGIRAINVLKYFVKKGVEPGRLSAIGYAQNHPRDRNDTLEGRKRNNRVEVVLVSPEGELRYKERSGYEIYKKNKAD
ncbi:MAG: OmpA family protein [bacterium]